MKSANCILKWIFYFFIFYSYGCSSFYTGGSVKEPQTRVSFDEIWGYLMKGEEKKIIGNEPFTHILYFSADLNVKGRIPVSISRPDITLKNGFKPDIHLVISELSNQSLMHFSLNPEYNVKDLLIEDICLASKDFDGIQIDFESVLPDDAENFWNFLSGLKSRIPSKMLSVAVPARTKDISDAYSYSKISSIADRMVIMAYDEHWSSSPPGPVASLPWCTAVVAFAKTVIDDGKIIMGLPLYGRAWQDKKLSKAFRFSQIQEITAKKNIRPGYKPESGPYFRYSEKVTISVFYDDRRSIMEKLKLYKSEDINSISFWRIGQSSGDLWNLISSEK